MAKIWFAQRESPADWLAVADFRLPELREGSNFSSAWYARIETKGTFTEDQAPVSAVGERRRVILVIERDEALRLGWKPGFYRIPMSPEEARAKLPGSAILTGEKESVSSSSTTTATVRGEVEEGKEVTIERSSRSTGRRSREARAVKFDRWERIGVDLIRADLKIGGHSFIGSDPQVRALAQEWLQRKDAEIAAAPVEARKRADRWFKRLWGAYRGGDGSMIRRRAAPFPDSKSRRYRLLARGIIPFRLAATQMAPAE